MAGFRVCSDTTAEKPHAVAVVLGGAEQVLIPPDLAEPVTELKPIGPIVCPYVYALLRTWPVRRRRRYRLTLYERQRYADDSQAEYCRLHLSSPLSKRLPQEPVVDVGAMNSHVARSTALVARVDHAVRRVVRIRDSAARSDTEIAIACVALEAKLSHSRTRQ